MIKLPFASAKAKITSPFGERIIEGMRQFHPGLDLVGISDYTVVSVTDGTVISSCIVTDKNNLTWEWGNYVCVQAPDGTKFYYCHLKSRSVSKGDKIQAGTKIGIMGNTGYSFGAHLHFEIRKGSEKINPAIYLGIPNKAGAISISSYDKALWKLTINKFIATPEYWEQFSKDTRVHDIIIRLEASFAKPTEFNPENYDEANAMKIQTAIDILYNEGVIMDKAFWNTNYARYKYIDTLFKRVAFALTN